MKVVGIGGGHGLAATLSAARRYSDEVAAVVTVADDGGSSGRLARELGIPAPGDIRNCLAALSDDHDLVALYQHRFQSGELTGHPAGNLIIAALAEMTGDFATAVERAGRLVRARGRVHPATTAVVDLHARVEGRVVRGQAAVGRASAPIQAVYLDPPDPEAHMPAVEAILGADQVILGPGSLFTSLIATLLVPGIGAAVRETNAARIFVCNTRRQEGETEGMSAASHLEAVLVHAGPFSLDAVVVQRPELPEDGVRIDLSEPSLNGVPVMDADVVDPSGGHDPARLAEVLGTLP